MLYKSCNSIENSLFFILNVITYCCSCGSAGDFIFNKNYNGEIINYDEFLETRNKFREIFKSGNIPERCRNCGHLHEEDWQDEFKLKYMCIAHRSKCSCNCFYCFFNEDKRYWNTRKVYDIIPALKNVLNTFPLEKNFSVGMVGGECSEIPKQELKEIVENVINHDGMLNFHSSGIFYSDAIAYALQCAKGLLIVSPDSGTNEVYKKIKRINKYNDFWNNLKKYSKVADDRYYIPISIKYIIIPGINDNKKEFEAFVNQCRKVGKFQILISIEYSWYDKNKDKDIPEDLMEFLEYIRTYENDINVLYSEAAIPLVQKYRTDFKTF